MLERRIETENIQINIYESGNKNGEAIIFIHPQGSTSKIWEPIIPFFEGDFHLILMDLRGHGESTKALHGYDIFTQCKDILAVLEDREIEKAHFVGNSLGGDIATAFASLYPDKVISLINIDSAMINYIGEDGERKLTKDQVIEEFKNREIMDFPSRAEMMEFVRHKFPSAIWDGYFENWFKYVSIYKLENSHLSYQLPAYINAQIMEMVSDLDYPQIYQNIKCPILFLPAETEANLPIKLKNIDIAKQYTCVKTSIIPNSKHLMILDQFLEVSKEMSTFLAEVKGKNHILF